MNQPSLPDVRTREEFMEDHASGAINIPLDQLVKRMEEIRLFPKPVIVYCRSGNRSAAAIQILKEHGIDKIVNGRGLIDIKIKYK